MVSLMVADTSVTVVVAVSRPLDEELDGLVEAVEVVRLVSEGSCSSPQPTTVSNTSRPRILSAIGPPCTEHVLENNRW